MSFGLGWREDPYDVRDRSSIEVYSATPPLAFEPASLRAYKRGPLYQNGFGACVAYALARAIHMGLLIDDEANGRETMASMPSPGFLYFNARRQETFEARIVGAPDVPVLDHGSQPRMMMRAAQTVGYCREVDYPFGALSEDIRSFPNDNRKPPPAAYVAAYDQRNLRYSRVYASGGGRKAEVARLLAAKVPVIFGMQVDGAFMRNVGERIEKVDLADSKGGHMLCVIEVTDDGVVFDNWWDKGWGWFGEGLLSWGVFGDLDVVGDVYAVEVVVPFSSEPA